MTTAFRRESMEQVFPPITPTRSADCQRKSINLALQGGGAHGAFTWGVLDRLLEEQGLAIEGISACRAPSGPPTVRP